MGAWRGLRAVARRLATMLRRGDFERRMDEEMRFHLDLEIEDRVRGGMSPREARRTAYRDFGGVERQKERAREVRGLALVDGVVQDVRFGSRVLRNRPLVAATAVVTLALGIGLPTAVFSFADALLFRPPAGVHDPDRLALVRMRAPHLEDEETPISWANLQDLRDMELPALTHLTGWAASRFQVAVPGRATTILQGAAVVGAYFDALGARPEAGRLLDGADTPPGAGETVVVISQRARGQLFGEGSPVGRRLTVNGVPLTVVGVAGGGLRGTDRTRPLDFWIPFSTYPQVRHREAWTYRERSATTIHDVLVRLAPGAGAEEAEGQLRQAMERLVERHPDVNRAYGDYRPTVFTDVGISPFARDRARATVTLLLWAAGLVLLVACANVANLLIFSGVRRRGESAVRRAMGASRPRLVRQHLTESAFLAVGGVGGGLLLAHLLLDVGAAWLLPGAEGLPPAGLDARVAGFAVAAGVASIVLGGLVPALTVGRFDVSEALKDTSRTETGRRARLRAGLTTAQLALSLGLVVAALLMDRTVRNLYRVDLGYETEGVVGIRIDPEPQGYEPARADALRGDLLRLAADLPGLEAVGGAAEAPLAVHFSADLRSGDDPGDDWPVEAWRDEVTPGFFATLGIPVVRGRTFTGEELIRSFGASSGVAVVSESLARRLFGTTDAVGRTLVSRGFRADDVMTVVGVVADHRVRSLSGPPEAVLYIPLGDGYSRGMVLLLRSARPTSEVVQQVRALVDRLDPALPFYEAGGLDERVATATADQRLLRRLMTFLAGVAALLAGVGLYGLVAYSVAERTREIGIRMAMGARAGGVVGLVVRESLGLVAIGLALGAGVGWLLTGLLESRLFGVEPLDPGTWILAGTMFLFLGVLAAAAPARSAARVDPMEVLRS